MSEVRNKRRYCLLKRIAFRRQNREDDVWATKQAAIPGTALPADFPHLATLNTAGYSMREDLDGADVPELRRAAPTLDKRQAEAVLAAFAAL